MGKLLYGLPFLCILVWILYGLYREWKNEPKNLKAEQVGDAAANKDFYRDTATEVKKQASVPGGDKKDRQKIDKFIDENS